MRKLVSISKISAPRLSKVVPRNRLFKIIDKGRKRGIIWLSAPAGSGKTTLVASYLNERKLPCLWYQVDEGDADAATFFYYMGLAVKNAYPKKKKTLPLLTPEYLAGITTFTHRYFEKLYGIVGSPFVIVLDNYQNVPVYSLFHEVIKIAASIIPKGITIIVVSRTEPQPLFGGADTASDLQIIGWNDIRFSLDESRQLLETQERTVCDNEMLLRLYTKTDGWAAGLLLISKGMRAAGIEPQRLEDLALDKIFNYFASEMLYKTDKETRDFLLKTSLLPSVNAHIAEYITGDGRAEQILAKLNRNHFFVEKQSQVSPVYQYHPLFRDFFISQAKQLFSPEDIAGIRHKAALLLEKSDRVEEAAGLFIEASDWDGLMRLILKNARTIIAQGRNRILEEWLNIIPEEIIEKNPWILYWKGVCRLSFEPSAARGYFEKAFGLFDLKGDSAGVFMSLVGVVDTVIYDLSYLYILDRWLEAIKSSIVKYRSFPSEEIEAYVTTNLFIGLAVRQPFNPELPYWLDKACSLSMQSSDVMLRLKTFQYAIVHNIWSGEIGKAGLFVKTMKEGMCCGDVGPFSVIFIDLIEAFYCYHAGMNDKCIELIHKLMEKAQISGINIFNHLAAGFGASASLSMGDMKAAGDFLEKMSVVLSTNRRNDLSFYHYLACQYSFFKDDISNALIHGEQALKFAEDSGSMIAQCVNCYLLSHILHELGRAKRAYELLSKTYELSGSIKNIRMNCMCLLSRAWFAFREGHEERAFKDLRESLTICKEKDYMNFDFWLPEMMSYLCAKAIENGIETKYVQKLIRNRGLIPETPPVEIENWPWQVKIYTLGRFEILKDGQRHEFTGKTQQKTLALLKAIIALGGREVKQDAIIDALWPEADGDAGHHAFETALYRLRKLIGAELLQLKDGRLSLDRRNCFVDVWCFESLFERLIKQGYGDRPAEASLLTEKLSVLYKGHFLSDETDEACTVPLRESLRNRFVSHLLRYGKACERAGRVEDAIERYGKGMEVDPLVEDFYSRTMECLHKTGRISEALSLYRRCEKVLSAVMGVPPSSATQKLYRQLMEETRK